MKYKTSKNFLDQGKQLWAVASRFHRKNLFTLCCNTFILKIPQRFAFPPAPVYFIKGKKKKKLRFKGVVQLVQNDPDNLWWNCP